MLKDEKLYKALVALRNEVKLEGDQTYQKWQLHIERDNYHESALNLAYYLALRRRDIRELQASLSPYGLSSLGRSEAKTLENLDAVIRTLGTVLGEVNYDPSEVSETMFYEGANNLQKNTLELFDKIPDHRNTAILVTLSREVASSEKMLKRLFKAGMNMARVNCSHDNEEVWGEMIRNVKKVSQELDCPCRILMDIAGPKTRIKALYTSIQRPRVRVGDRIFLTGEELLRPFYGASIVLQSSIPDIIPILKEGAAVLIDDGMVETYVCGVYPEGVMLEVKHILSEGSVRLRAEKGLNFPLSNQSFPILTEKDLRDLPFVAEHADIIAISFVRNASDIRKFQKHLVECIGLEQARKKGIMAKIETVEGANNLPEIIVAGAAKNPFSIMIARGDLAVEAGYMRLAELQEEILWLCEAAQVPVVWATEILSSLVKTGIPTRAEVTDAAMAGRAEGAMLNKGKYIVEGVQVLDNILTRMVDHQYKKTPRLRALSLAELREL